MKPQNVETLIREREDLRDLLEMTGIISPVFWKSLYC